MLNQLFREENSVNQIPLMTPALAAQDRPHLCPNPVVLHPPWDPHPPARSPFVTSQARADSPLWRLCPVPTAAADAA